MGYGLLLKGREIYEYLDAHLDFFQSWRFSTFDGPGHRILPLFVLAIQRHLLQTFIEAHDRNCRIATRYRIILQTHQAYRLSF